MPRRPGGPRVNVFTTNPVGHENRLGVFPPYLHDRPLAAAYIYPENRWLFVTWHLHGSLPQGMYPPPGKASAEAALVWMDRYLDLASTGPRFLCQPKIARVVIQCLHKGVALNHYESGAFVVIANHVHVLLFPHIAPSRLLRSLKGSSAREANRMLNRTGESFWQAESYDHWVRDKEEHKRIIAYIETNPVKAGLVERAKDCRWSSANRQERLDTSVETADVGVSATSLTFSIN